MSARRTSCRASRFAAVSLALLGFAASAAAESIGLYPLLLSQNTTGQANSHYIGPPNDDHWAIGGRVVTYDFGAYLVFDGAGQDFNVYEVDFGAPEFNLVDVSVSADGTNFFSVSSTIANAVDLVGDDLHGDPLDRRSFDLGPSGLSAVRFIRIDGNGTAAPTSRDDGFDLDAIGAVNFQLGAPVPLPAVAWGGLALLGSFGATRSRSRRR